ncbi:Eco57I restriction-modification methylase domain-containing protein [Anabaena cylindrica FACHB-243]|uniref:site-specific DNA-methyltransferase (adenine-specific) n=1 Tax=Anabaena cylindrica (strain ATCC 27899 / PCC 7122) TaxID=272123 RepID=K9ZAU9_ANACC|nr:MULTISPECIES: BsuBI/PstI family type II restriction endonuclease [Anabaena]AFZ56301.1 Site-specific DNA-methyltransferase (adenine-specific), Type II site-specific deoxyribonuclease [Anabaena cylindrica PCC 7122]MBD2417532.1 Eco57I restriction-modification methylase domain-containing protein [Anabaena cylindrica FACHB-243]MBY5283724.1 N-6 DNA methylase [Anabaena sp. CCAP 1446/1C]MBY5311016.1 N-6 DNA methylase [Anabaena sp. CCAP 1446/1C]MCM2407702.1 Eco57I restriction-modification methylase 
MAINNSRSLSLVNQDESICENLLTQVNSIHLTANNQLTQSHKIEMGQFLTPDAIARFMANMFDFELTEISLLDAGAGTGSLLTAVVFKLCQRLKRPKYLHITAYEIDPFLIDFLEKTLKCCENACYQLGIKFTYTIHQSDFIESVVNLLQYPLLADSITTKFTHAILNPPYYKINSQSKYRLLLRSIGLETTNIYTGFIFAVIKLLKLNGQLVAITPRSFCNGSYFREFRQFFLENMALEKIHLFNSRKEVFSNDKILQETVIVHAYKQSKKPDTILISSSINAEDDLILSHHLCYSDVIDPQDQDKFIHIIPDTLNQQIVEQMKQFFCTLQDLGLNVSTGKVVDFRIKPYLRLNPEKGTVPLIYPTHFDHSYISYPKKTKKCQAIVLAKETNNLLIPNENYVLTKRFSSKEEKKRVVAVVYDATKIDTSSIGFENHLNYFHQQGQGLDLTLAKGLTAYLNSSLVDSFFRLFNGHTQVNATDLRNLKYPTLEQLYLLGKYIGVEFPNQSEIDKLIDRLLLNMTDSSENNPIIIKARIEEAIEILADLGFPKKQLNERSGLTLLALLDLKPYESWISAKAPLLGITPMMEFMEQQYAKKYAPNTRETVRRQTVHQFIDAGLIVVNPDNIERPVNSPKTVYQIEDSALEMLRTFKTDEWDKNLQTYLASIETLKNKYAQARLKARIEVNIPGASISLSPGGQNILIEKIINDFCPRFTPNSNIIYVGDTDEKFAYFEKSALSELGIKIDTHGKMPDIIIHFQAKNWLVLIEAVTSHGPIDAKRKTELESLFKSSQIPLVMVTAFLNRKAMKEYLPEISWETDVWVAEDGTHLIHFNGENLLQIY